jgi:hypothetical protein
VCQFGERQYELAANLELLAGSGSFFAPTTSVEGQLAIDVALTPGDPRVWRLLGIRPPPGVSAGPAVFGAWPAGSPSTATPPFLVSLFIQYKRSTHLTRPTAKEWHRHTMPYWRIDLSTRQHRLLQDLEIASGSDAAVRYAAPKFWEHRDMWRLQGGGAIMDNSLLIAPSAVEARHTRLTWSPVHGLVGHSAPESLPVETVEDLGRALIARVGERRREVGSESPRVHLATLATSVAELSPSLRRRDQWHDAIAAEAAFRVADDEMIGPLADMAMVAEAAYEVGASWLILALAEPGS